MGWGTLLFGEALPWQSVGGALLVMACAITTLLKKRGGREPGKRHDEAVGTPPTKSKSSAP